MRVLLACFAMVSICSANYVTPDADRAKKLLQSNNYTATWGAPSVFGPEAELEIGDGNGHGGTLGWIRFKPGKESVNVLSIQFNDGRQPYESRWPPDCVTVSIKQAELKTADYSKLLSDLAVVDSAKFKPVERRESSISSNDFWVYVHLTADNKTLLNLNWAGYESSENELKFAKPRASVLLAREAIKGLEYQDHVLTVGERAWASAKFTRDWKEFKGLDFHWWVRERYIQTIGVVGDESALLVLRDILATDPPKEKLRESSDYRYFYNAINAVTRLTKKDVRDNPIEEMDIEKTRLKVLDLIKDKK